MSISEATNARVNHPHPVDLYQRPLRDVRISLTDHCNLRCAYCMPKGHDLSFLATDRYLSFSDIIRLVRIFVSLGVRKIKLTGGEPILRPDIEGLVKSLRAIDDRLEINLITNGVFLREHVAGLKAAGLNRLTVSLDTLRPERFPVMDGRESQLERIFEGIALAQQVGFSPIKINMVVMRGKNDDEVLEMAKRFRHTGMVLRFIEYMDVGTINGWKRELVVPSSEILGRLQTLAPLIPLAAKAPGETARRYAYADSSGEVGFISSVTEPFCGACSRLRLSADGQVFTCLFASIGLDLKPLLAGEDGPLRSALVRLWQARTDRYSMDRSEAPARQKIQMFYIGG